jgi:hypothetical protein
MSKDNPTPTVPMTEEQFKAALPVQVKKLVTQELMDQINQTLSSPETMELYKENLLSYASVLKEGRFKMTSYISAVKYVSFKLLGSTNRDAYIKTFPDKYARFLADGVPDKDIASYSTAYNKSKLVNLIYEQTLIPLHVLNAPIQQAAINTLAHLMNNAVSEKVRSDSANALLTHLKRPETQKIELDIGINQGSVIDDYQMVMAQMVQRQKELILAGGDLKQITNTPIKVNVIDI